MKRFTKALFAVMAAAVLALALALTGCSKEDSIVKAFEKEGYTVTVVKGEEAYKSLSGYVSEEDEEQLKKYDYINCIKGSLVSGLGSAVIVKYPSAKVLKEKLGDDYDREKDKGKINGDCYLVENFGNALAIFKKA